MSSIDSVRSMVRPDAVSVVPGKTSPLSPFEIARHALGHVGRYKTPPTPSVYEVWYRYVEGVEDITQSLSHSVDDKNSVSVDFLEQLHQQYCAKSVSDGPQLTDQLINEMSALQSVVDEQIQAGRDFGKSIDEACGTLDQENPSLEVVAACAKSLVVSNAAMQKQIEALNERLQASQATVHDLQHELTDSQRATMTDPMTGLGNRRHFDVAVRGAMDNIDQTELHSFLFLLDVDHFKAINDTFGHESGDRVIQYVASQLTRLCPNASISRLGGDEFAIIADVSDRAEANHIGAEIRTFFSSTPLKLSGSGDDLGTVKLSIGGACLRANDDKKSWYVRADQLLYQAKENGRNSAVVEHVR